MGAKGSATVSAVLTDIQVCCNLTLVALFASLKHAILQGRLQAGPVVSGKVWEALGAAWADSGSFNNAIGSYRRSLRAKSANASLVAMEQLGNLLVRRAQQVWAQARTGAVDAALKAGQEALVGSTSNVLLSRQLQRQTRAAELKGTKVRCLCDGLDATFCPRDIGPLMCPPSMQSLGDDDGGEEAEEEQPPWREAAAALMYEGLAYIERMCSLGSTPERRSLLGSAYKRRAWTGLGPNRTDDLQQAALNYAAAHELEMEEGRAQPSPYARLNQLTLEMLAGDGSERDK